MPNERYHKTGKHFFNQPRQDAKIEINEKFKDIKNLPTEVIKPITLGQILAKIKRVLSDQNLDLMKILEYHDKLKTGNYFRIFIIIKMFRGDHHDPVFLYFK